MHACACCRLQRGRLWHACLLARMDFMLGNWQDRGRGECTCQRRLDEKHAQRHAQPSKALHAKCGRPQASTSQGRCCRWPSSWSNALSADLVLGGGPQLASHSPRDRTGTRACLEQCLELIPPPMPAPPQVDRYKQLLLKQRDIMIALTARLNERDEQIMALQVRAFGCWEWVQSSRTWEWGGGGCHTHSCMFRHANSHIHVHTHPRVQTC